MVRSCTASTGSPARRVDSRVGAQTLGDVAAQRHGVDDDHPRAHADRRRRRHQTDGASARDDDGLGGVGPAVAQDRVEAAGEGLDQRALRVVHRIRQLVQPLRPGREIFAVGAVHREAEMVDALGRVDHAFADHAVAGLQGRHVAAGLDDLADPFVAGNDGIGDRDDVLSRQQLVVGMADADAARADQDFVVVDARALHLRDDGLSGFVENKGLHL